MAQIFSRAADTWLRLGILTALVAIFGGVTVALLLQRSDYVTGRGWPVQQPLPFSHAHHAGELRIDCRFCHASVERSATASLPPTQTCMTCHSQIWRDSDVLEPLRRSLREQESLHWKRVIEMPDYVYFNHQVHVQNGVGCETCHGQVDRMQQVFKAKALDMGECLACHRDPAPNLRPRQFVTVSNWHTEEDRRVLGERLMKEYGIHPQGLTDCAVCHR